MAGSVNADAKTGIGVPLPRIEDVRFLTGQGRYADDMTARNMAFACIVRSPHAHARILDIDKRAALAAPGVLSILAGEDVANDKLAPLRCRWFPKLPPGTPSYCSEQLCLRHAWPARARRGRARAR